MSELTEAISAVELEMESILHTFQEAARDMGDEQAVASLTRFLSLQAMKDTMEALGQAGMLAVATYMIVKERNGARS